MEVVALEGMDRWTSRFVCSNIQLYVTRRAKTQSPHDQDELAMERRGGGRRDRRRSRSRSRFEQMHCCLCPLLTFSSIQTYPPSLLHRKSRRRAAAAAPLLLYNVKRKKYQTIFQGKEEQEQGQEWPLLIWKAGRRRRRGLLGVCEEISERDSVTSRDVNVFFLFINNGLIVRRLNWYTPI